MCGFYLYNKLANEELKVQFKGMTKILNALPEYLGMTYDRRLSFIIRSV